MIDSVDVHEAFGSADGERSSSKWENLPSSQAAFLDAIALAEERGAWDAVRFFLGWKEAIRLDASGGEPAQTYLRAVRERLADAEMYEANHGRGSLLKLDHPFNQRLDRMMERMRESAKARWHEKLINALLEESRIWGGAHPLPLT